MRVAVLLPCRDEARALPAVLAGLLPGPHRVVLCDNGSRDGSPELGRSLGAEVVFEPQRGYGGAVLAGIALLQADPPDIVVIMDADHSNYAEDLPALIGPIARGAADMVIGERLTLGAPGGLTPPQRVGNRLATGVIRLQTGHRYLDMGPFRAIRWQSLVALQMEDRTWGWNVEMQIKAVKRGLKVIEVPVRNRPRIGQSKISGTVSGVARAGAKIAYACWKYR
jgi:glycosyltransferase involved in cell wall biosynthesis